jgi:two-component system, chemotaxis family, chemotaxis protein CheV
MNTEQLEIDQRTNLAGSNMFEMLLFRLGQNPLRDRNELFGMNVFKIREILAMPEITAVASSQPNLIGLVNLRGQLIPVIDLPAILGCVPSGPLKIMLVTEYARTTQAFAIESVEDIARLDWSQVLSAESTVAGGLVTSVARLDGNVNNSRLALVLDVETILRELNLSDEIEITPEEMGKKVLLKPGMQILAADDSVVARTMIEQALKAMGLPYIMTKTGKEAWEKLNEIATTAEAEGLTVQDKIALVVTDIEMPEMDGFTLTRNIKQDPRYRGLPVVIHSSLSGSTNEEHVKKVGADGYMAKFQADEFAAAIREVLERTH